MNKSGGVKNQKVLIWRVNRLFSTNPAPHVESINKGWPSMKTKFHSWLVVDPFQTLSFSSPAIQIVAESIKEPEMRRKEYTVAPISFSMSLDAFGFKPGNFTHFLTGGKFNK